jgi:hypothetical protein
MSNELMNILQNNPQIVQTGLDEDTLALAGGTLNASKRLSIKGGAFRKIVGGKEVGVIEDRHMNVIFVKMAHTASRMYYESTYSEGQKVRPTCWSTDSRTPDADVKTPVAASCDSCPNSVKGSSPTGIGSKCRLSWKTAVVLPQDPSGDVLEFTIPGKSCFGDEDNGKWPFRPYVRMLANNNISAGRVITRVAFDIKEKSPKVMFSPSAAVPAEHMAILQEQAKSQAAENAIKTSVYQGGGSEDTEEAPKPTPTPHPMGAGYVAPQAFTAPTQQSDVKIDEPVLRDATQAQVNKDNDVSDIVKKWAAK